MKKPMPLQMSNEYLPKEDRKARFEKKKQDKDNWKPQFKVDQVVLVKEILFEGKLESLSQGPWWGTIVGIDKDRHLYSVRPFRAMYPPIGLPVIEEQIVGERK